MKIHGEDWAHIKALFAACLEADEDARALLLGDETTVPPAIRAEVEALLAAHAASAPLEEGAIAYAAPLIATEAAPARQVGPYRLERRLGAGGMGEVWLGVREGADFEQRVALKLIRVGLDSEELRERFRRERAILARLAHDRIARLLEGGVDEAGRPWFAMEYVAGEPISAWCDARRLSIAGRVALLLDVAEAVAHAHRNLVVHRDLKPGNVLVTPEGAVKLLDFGIAKLVEDRDDAAQTATGAVPMTPAYAAPEQIEGRPVGTATDVYALGVLLYELLCGRSPYAVDPTQRHALAQAILACAPERLARAVQRPGAQPAIAAIAAARGTDPRTLCRRLDRDLDQIIGLALAKAPEQRYAGVDALAADLHAWLAGRPLLSRPVPAMRRLAKFVGRHRLGVAAAALVATTTLAGLVMTLAQMRQTVRHAETERAVRGFLSGLFTAIDPEQARGREVPLREVLEAGARQAGKGLRDQPAVRGALLSDLGAIYTSLGDLPRASALLAQARDALATAPDRDDDELARVWLRLAKAEFQAGRYDAAAENDARAMALLSARPALDPLRAAAEIQRVRIESERDRLDEASARAEALLAALRAAPDTAPDVLVDALTAFGNLRRLQRRYEEAETAMQEALGIQRARDPDSPAIASTLHELAAVVGANANAPKAVSLLREALALHQRVNGPRHPLTLSTEGELANWLATSGDTAEAEPLFRADIEARKAVFGPRSDSAATSVNNYAVMLYGLRRFAEAAPLFAEAHSIWAEQFGPDHSHTRTALTGEGGALLELGRHAEAEPILKSLYEASQRLDAPRGRGSASVTYALLLERTGRLDEAADLMRREVTSQIEAFGGDEVQYPYTRTVFGRVLREQGHLDEARGQLEAALHAYDIDAFPDGVRTATCLVELARVLEAQRRDTERIRTLLERALPVQEAKLGAGHAETQATREWLARIR